MSTQVHFHRVLQYLVRTICRRLSVTLTCGESSGLGLFLPIPLNQCRVLERLGAITMVCFVDDDIICENYSVTEEIFLLVDHKNHDHDRGGGGGGGGLRRGGGAHGQRSAAADQHSHSQAHSHSQPAFIRTGLVLDLHGSPEATGSRFENPEWWRYLPSLKPLGLNALLTYSATDTDTDTGMGDLTSAAAAPSQIASPQPLLPLTAHTAPTPPIHPSTQQSLPRPGPRGPRGQTGLAPDGESHLPPSFLSSLRCLILRLYLPSVPLLPGGDPRDPEGEDAEESEGRAAAGDRVSRSLVRHIRDHPQPQELLRELSEEIGFVKQDTLTFCKKCDLTLLLPHSVLTCPFQDGVECAGSGPGEQPDLSGGLAPVGPGGESQEGLAHPAGTP